MKTVSIAKTVPDYLRDGRFRHVAGVLDEEPPWILRKITPMLSSRVVIDEYVQETLKDLGEKGPIIYAMKFRSIYDLHYLRLRFAQLHLPVPCFAFGVSPAESGSLLKWVKVWTGRAASAFRQLTRPAPVDEAVLREIFEAGGAGVLFLVDEKTTRDRYVYPDVDPIRILLDLQGRMAASIAVVPMVVLYDRRQPRTIRPFWESFLGDPDQPGPMKRLLIATRKWTKPELLIGEPIHLVGQFEEFGSERSWEELPFEVRKDLIDLINARIRVNRGPERLSRTEIKERVLQDPRLKKAVLRAVTRDPGSESKVRKQAESYVDEIAGDQRIQVHHFLYYVLRWLLSTIFDGMDLRESQFSILKTRNQEGSLIYVSCHKSHLDYLLVGYLSFINQMAIPYMAAGKNLSFWPVGPILRNAGAFFIRRTFKGLGLYPHVFAAYLKVLVKEKVNINFYIEGARSRTGKLLPPRVGMLAFLLQAVKEGSVKDLTFVPTYVGYDQVPEESSYLREQAGRDKQQETVFAFLKSREILKKRFGRAYVRFNEPVSYMSFCDRFASMNNSASPSSVEANRKLLNGFAYHIMSGIVRAGVVTPIELVAAGLACANQHQVKQGFLMEVVGHFVDMLAAKGIELVESLDDIDKVVETTVGLFKVRGFLDVDISDNESGEAVYLINVQKRANLDFYRNSLVNYLWAESIMASVLLARDREDSHDKSRVLDDFRFLKELLSKELIWDPLVPDDEIVEQSLNLFRAEGWLGNSDETSGEIIDKRGLESLRGILTDLLGVYHLVLETSGEIEDDGMSQKEFTKRLLKKSADRYPDDEARPAPTAGRVPIANALARFAEMDILEYKQGRKEIEFVKDREQRDRVRDILASALNLPH